MYVGSLQVASNKATYRRTFKVYDDDGELVDLDDDDLVMVFEFQDDGITELSATIANGKIEVLSLGTFEVLFTRTEMNGLCAKTYDIGLTISPDGDTEENNQQFIIGTQQVVDGKVT
jgi:hypothetical protein